MSILNKLPQRILMTFSWGRNCCSHFANEGLDVSKPLTGGEPPCLWGLTSWDARCEYRHQPRLALGHGLKSRVVLFQGFNNSENTCQHFQLHSQLCTSFASSLSCFTQIYFTGKLTIERRNTWLCGVLPTQIPHDLVRDYLLEHISWNLPLHAASSSHRGLCLQHVLQC